MSNGKKWTEEENNLVISGQYTTKELVVKLGRTHKSVRHQCVKLGYEPPNYDRGNRPWVDEEIKIIKSKEYTYAEMAMMFNRTHIAVRVMANKLDVAQNPSPQDWSENELRLLKKSELTIEELAKQLNRTASSVQHKRSRLGLCKEVEQKKWEQWENDLILQEENPYEKLQEIADKLGRTWSSVNHKYQDLGLTTPMNYWKVEELDILMRGDLDVHILADLLERPVLSVSAKAIEMGIKLPIRPSTFFNKDFFKVFTPKMAYLLGFFWADGCIGSRDNSYYFTISSKDTEHLEKFRDIMESQHNIHFKKDGCQQFTISSKDIYDDLINLGSSERKSLTAIFPPTLPLEYFYDFVRGYNDGDGSVFYNRKTFYPRVTMTGTRDFLSKVIEIVNLPYSLRYNNAASGNLITSNLDYCGLSARELLNRMYSGADLYLERKYQSYLQTLKWVPKKISKKKLEAFYG